MRRQALQAFPKTIAGIALPVVRSRHTGVWRRHRADAAGRVFRLKPLFEKDGEPITAGFLLKRGRFNVLLTQGIFLYHGDG